MNKGMGGRDGRQGGARAEECVRWEGQWRYVGRVG